MLELRPSCELCGTALAATSDDARVCSYECTFCADCATWQLHGICPNCGGELVARPRRPAGQLDRNPPRADHVRRDHDVAAHQAKVHERLLADDLPAAVWSVAFANQRSGTDDAGYYATAGQMNALAHAQPGHLRTDSVRNADGTGITVSRWSSLAAMLNWRRVESHALAQQTGRDRWYRWYRSEVGRVDRLSAFEAPPEA